MGHNILDFDLPLLYCAAMRVGIDVGSELARLGVQQVYDTCFAARKLLPQNPGGYSLDACCSRFGIGHQGDRHRADADVKLTLQLFQHLRGHTQEDMDAAANIQMISNVYGLSECIQRVQQTVFRSIP